VFALGFLIPLLNHKLTWTHGAAAHPNHRPQGVRLERGRRGIGSEERVRERKNTR